jgi:hypothetical protein
MVKGELVDKKVEVRGTRCPLTELALAKVNCSGFSLTAPPRLFRTS